MMKGDVPYEKNSHDDTIVPCSMHAYHDASCQR